MVSLLAGDDNDKESSPFLSSDTDTEHYYEDKNMALFEVHFYDSLLLTTC